MRRAAVPFTTQGDVREGLMGFSPRDAAGGNFTSATWIAAEGAAAPYRPGKLVAIPLETSRVEGRDALAAYVVRPCARHHNYRAQHSSLVRPSHPLLGRSGAGDRNPHGDLEMTGYERQ